MAQSWENAPSTENRRYQSKHEKYKKANIGVFDNFVATKTKQQLTKLHVQLLHLHAVQDLCSSCVCDK